MVAIISNSDYYKGNYNTFNIKSLIAKAGGNSLHSTLFNILFTPTFINTKERQVYHDSRSSFVSTCIFPSYIQIPLLILNHFRELQLLKNYEGLNLSVSIITPLTFLRLLYQIDNKSLDGYWSTLLKNLSLTNLNTIEELLGLPQNILSNPNINDAIANVLAFYNLPDSTIDVYTLLFRTNDRKQAIVLLSNWLGYPTIVTNGLLEQMELWQYKISYI